MTTVEKIVVIMLAVGVVAQLIGWWEDWKWQR